jgi:hypothetical protein
MSQTDLLDRYKAACDYPATLDEAAVEKSLGEYLAALDVERKIVRLPSGWSLADHPSIDRQIREILDEWVKGDPRRLAALDALAARDAIDARDARDARDAIDALDARAALDARDARAALDARDALAALAALDALAARDAIDALAALDALAARDAIDALDARDAIDARNARDARDAIDARNARDARDAIDARNARNALDARDAPIEALQASLHRFAAWCIQSSGWWTWRWEISWIVTTHFGALERKDAAVQRWSGPLLEAFLSGVWLLHWTSDALYWVAKPTVHKDPTPNTRRLHNDRYAALESDIENLYFWHGVMVPAFVIVRPEWITVKHIETETNAEVRRVMIERMGQTKYLLESKAEKIGEDQFGELYRKEIPNDEPLVMVRVVNSTPEADGSRHIYFLRVPPQMKMPREAVAWTFGMDAEKYQPQVET